jgi:hypothetical protein
MLRISRAAAASARHRGGALSRLAAGRLNVRCPGGVLCDRPSQVISVVSPGGTPLHVVFRFGASTAVAATSLDALVVATYLNAAGQPRTATVTGRAVAGPPQLSLDD